jgi:hypothetical protein
MRLAAKTLSVLLHPVWMPTLLVVMGFTLDPFLALRFLYDDRLLILYTMVFVMTALFPLLSTWMLYRSGLIGSLEMPRRQERILVFVLTLLYYVMSYWLLRRTTDHPVTLSLFFGCIVALVMTLLITLRWKISAHMVGFGGLIGALSALTATQGVHAPFLLAALFVLGGILGSARLIASDHSPAQVYAGVGLGTVTLYTSVMMGLHI